MHSDICGPITPKSNSHKRYILTFIDDYSHKMWTYFLHAKLEAFAMFKIFKSMVEKEKANYISSLRTDQVLAEVRSSPHRNLTNIVV